MDERKRRQGIKSLFTGNSKKKIFAVPRVGDSLFRAPKGTFALLSDLV